jgi:hypothetical protein
LNKTKNRLAAAVLSVIISLATLGAPAAAAADGDNNADFNGNTKPPFSFTETQTYAVGGSRGEIKDFFGEITKNLSPGDTKTVTVRLKNTADRDATFWLIATPLDDTETATLLADGSPFAGKTASEGLLDQIVVVIRHDVAATSQEMYEGPMSGRDSPVAQLIPYTLPIGTVTPNNTATITVELRIPDTLGNKYQNTLAAVDWTFYVEMEEPEQPSGPPGVVVPPAQPNQPDTPAQPNQPAQPANPAPPVNNDETIEDAPPPLTEYTPPIIDDDETTIDEEEIPLADFEVAPKTGDDAPGMMTFATVAAIALVTIIVLLMTGGRKKNKTAA